MVSGLFLKRPAIKKQFPSMVTPVTYIFRIYSKSSFHNRLNVK